MTQPDAQPDGQANAQANAQITRLLRAWRSGESDAMDQLMPLVYDQLRSMAGHYMRKERQDHTLRPTALVHEAYLKLISLEVSWQDRVHFMALAATMMRRILVDHARTHRRVKRGSGAEKIEWEDALQLHQPSSNSSLDMLDLDEALARLAQQDARKARVIELTYFGGMNSDEVSAALELSTATVNRDLQMGRAWLRKELSSSK